MDRSYVEQKEFEDDTLDGLGKLSDSELDQLYNQVGVEIENFTQLNNLIVWEKAHRISEGINGGMAKQRGAN